MQELQKTIKVDPVDWKDLDMIAKKLNMNRTRFIKALIQSITSSYRSDSIGTFLNVSNPINNLLDASIKTQLADSLKGIEKTINERSKNKNK